MTNQHLAGWESNVFAVSRTEEATLRQIRLALGQTTGKRCLCINGGGAGAALRLCGGGAARWESLHRREDVAAFFLAQDVKPAGVLSGGRLPFADNTFDVIVLLDYLEHDPAPQGLVADCHRALVRSGRLVITARHAKRWSLLRALQKVLALNDPAEERRTYTGPDLFELLKDGFDVEGFITYSRFFIELTESWIQWLIRFCLSRDAGAAGDAAGFEKAARIRRWSYPFARVAELLDPLLFFTPGYGLVLRARRRIWSPRRVPVLRDGRSISEAAIQTKIGTARPY